MAQSSSSSSSSLQFAHIRSLDDFLLESARFQLPNFNDIEKWGNRVVKNLLYYQTNYFIMAAALFTLIGLVHPAKIVYGIILIGVIIYVLMTHFSSKSRQIQVPEGTNKWLILAGVCGSSYFILYILDAILIVLFAILLPFCLTFVHASLRLRNMKNKITNTIETIGMKQSPMGQFLEEMGLMPDTF